jgi:hypothetical protein
MVASLPEKAWMDLEHCSGKLSPMPFSYCITPSGQDDASSVLGRHFVQERSRA